MPSMKAVLRVEAIVVLCPHCDEPLPENEAGSHMWRPDQVAKMDGQTVQCSSCQRHVRIVTQSLVRVG